MKRLKELKDLVTKDRVKKFGIDMIFVLVGCAIGAFAIIGILIPNGLSSGGITGLCRILQETFGLNFSILYYCFSITILVICAIVLGLGEARKIILITIIYPPMLMLFERLDLRLLEENDIILAVVYCGLFTGINSGLFFTRGFSFGGTDTISKIIKKKFLPHVGLSQILLVLDAIVIITSGFVFGRNIALYALVTQIIFSKVVEYVMYGFQTKVVQLEIITDHHDEIVHFIINEIGRGVSNVEIIGEYTQQARDKIVTLCSPRESMLIKQYVAKIDRTAFVTVIRVESVWGTGAGFEVLTDKEDNKSKKKK